MKTFTLGLKGLFSAGILAGIMATSPSCGSKTDKVNDTSNVQNNDTSNKGARMNAEDIVDLIQSIPSPLELTLLIKELKSDYKKADLNSPEFASDYASTYKQALNLGIYGTDLGYANIFRKSQDVLVYLGAVKKLAEKLNIGKYFDYEAIEKLASSSGNPDSLLEMTTSNFEKINLYLRDKHREHESLLLLTGGWLEGLHLTCLIYDKSKNDKLKEKIGEQKLILDRILIVLEVYKDKPNFNELIADLKELGKAYEKVSISLKQLPPVTKVVNGEVVIEDQTESIVEMTPEDAAAISGLVKTVRNKIISNKS